MEDPTNAGPDRTDAEPDPLVSTGGFTACPDEDTILAYLSAKASPALRAAIEPHLDACATCRELVATLVGDSGAPAPGTDRPTSRPALSIPRQVGRYRVGRRLGAGGMAVVMEGWDPTLSRPVAIKFLKPSSTNAEGAARLLREARALAALSHPNVVPVFEAGLVAPERRSPSPVYVVMEMVDGRSLREWIDGRTHSHMEILDRFVHIII